MPVAPHVSFPYKNAPVRSQLRESIEVRSFVFHKWCCFYRQFGNHLMILIKKCNICFYCMCRAIINDRVPFEANIPCQIQLMVPKIPLKIMLSRRRRGRSERSTTNKLKIPLVPSLKQLQRFCTKHSPTIQLNSINLLQQQSSRYSKIHFSKYL